ncbi:sigma-70 family RNA polymerase sigma factor [uncultured Acetobacterium sp.]|uniref:RNA polymerase sigma factor n=1 Tax=uncultured Acetobacterium sp. TaxID=217139 RepID=UPI0025F014D9|nr:sigma-70 family RNA polymerase sigma factor [uncultured Acetobacterium sp.]
MRKFKTPEKSRTSYTYYSVDGSKIEIMPDEDRVSTSVIAVLHAWDDQEFNANNREIYHIPVHLESYQDASDEDATDRNPYLIDPEPNPMENFIQSIDAGEHEDRLAKLRSAIETLLPQQKALIQKVFYEGRTNVDIAAEEGVSEAAIRNRLKKIFNNLRKKI